MQKKVFCYYFDSVPNFGDLLNKDLFNFFQKDIEFANKRECDVFAIGSILQALFQKKQLKLKKRILLKIKKPLVIYGSGFIEDIPSICMQLDV